MIWNPGQLRYACIAKGAVVLAELVSKEEPGIEAVALRCIENTPPHHSAFSHTVGNKTYTFAIHDSFVYFAILDEAMDKPESSWLLHRLRSALEDLIPGGEALIDPLPHCLQSQLDPVFAEILHVDLVGSPRSLATASRNPSIDSSKGRRAALMPLLGKALKKKKKRSHTKDDSPDVGDNNLDLCGNGTNGLVRKQLRNAFLTDHHHTLKAKQIWRKHVCLVLIFDFCICALLFGIWLWVCQGFQCIHA